jgi:hypothetical protein
MKLKKYLSFLKSKHDHDHAQKAILSFFANFQVIKSRIAVAVSVAFSKWGTWPHSGIQHNRLWGILCWNLVAAFVPKILSCSPQIISVEGNKVGNRAAKEP